MDAARSAVARVGSACDSVVTSLDVLASISVGSLNTGGVVTRTGWDAILEALASLVVSNLFEVAGLCCSVVHILLAFLGNCLEVSQSIAAVLISAASGFDGVDTSSSLNIARVLGASDSIVTSSGGVLADDSSGSLDT
jgi:hypothetical protein